MTACKVIEWLCADAEILKEVELYGIQVYMEELDEEHLYEK